MRNDLMKYASLMMALILALPGCSEHHTGLAVDLDTYRYRLSAGQYDMYIGEIIRALAAE